MTTLKIVSPQLYSAVTELLRKDCNKTDCTALFNEFKTCFKEPYAVEVSGTKVPLEDFIAKKKISAYNSDEMLRLVALFIHNPETVQRYLRSLPEEYLKLMKMLMQDKYISREYLKKKGYTIFLSQENYYYYSRDENILKEHNLWFSTVASTAELRSTGYYGYDKYISLKFKYIWILSPHLSPTTRSAIFSEQVPEDLEIIDAQQEALTAYPVIKGLIKQGTLKTASFKISQLLSLKIMSQLPIKDIIPSLEIKGQKYNMGQYYLPYLYQIEEKKLYHEAAKRTYEFLCAVYPELSIPTLLPHIKGFKQTVLRHYGGNGVFRLASEMLAQSKGYWINLEKLALRTIDTPSNALSSNTFSELDLINTITESRICLSGLTHEINYPLIQAFFTVLYALGGVTLACKKPDKEDCFTPVEHILYAKLNDLGKYMTGISKEYTAPLVEKKKLFELDDRHLIIRSLESGNPYESLLNDTAINMGNGRYRMSPESFLSNCKNKEDVKEKTDFFKEYICSELPAIWEDFFAGIAKRCRPFVSDDTRYKLFNIAPDDKELATVLSSDPVLKGLIIKAEGYRILVPSDKEKVFEDRLKSFGYLV